MASSSPVYGGNDTLPFRVEDRVDQPLSLYAATKKADELMSGAYAHLPRLPRTGLRFFTVYGPWGRPDMAMWLFTKAIFDGRPINVAGEGRMHRDFTYINDIVAGVSAIQRDLGFEPCTSIAEGVPRFVQWCRDYHGLEG